MSIEIIIAIIATIPPILDVVSETYTKQKIKKKNKEISPKILKIMRIPLNSKDYKRVKHIILFWMTIGLSFILFFLINTLLYSLDLPYLKVKNDLIVGKLWGLEINLIVVFNLIFFIIYIFAFVKAYIRMGSSPKDIKHFLLEEGFICLECDFKTAVNHCIETFRILGARILETDLKKGTIEAYTIDNMIHIFGGLYKIQIYEERKKYNIKRTYITVKYDPKYSIINQKIIQSLSINKFIRFFSD